MLLELHILGTVQIHAAGHEFPVGEPRQQTALAALSIDAGRTVLVDTLVDRVWGDAPPRQARRSLQAHIARIRRSLAQAAAAAGGGQDQPLVRDAGGYRLDVDPHRVDLLRFRALLESARPAEIDDHVRAASLRAALGLWRGDPLSGPTGSWAERIRHSVRAEYVDAVVAWAAAEIRIGNADAVLGRLTELADEHPLLETATATLMRALYAAGRAAEALRRYDHIRRGLRDELGADPGPRLRAVHEAVLRHDLPLATAARTVPAQLPADVAAFTGRAGELAELDGLLGGMLDTTAGGSTIVCVTGTAGVGKTALAVHWATRVLDRFPDGQLYVDLRGYDPERPVAPADALAAFLTALGVDATQIPLRLDVRAARCRSELAGRRMLIMLDNAASVDQLRPLLPGGSTCLVVVTSRDSLAGLIALHGARRVALEQLPAPDAIALLRRLIGPRVDDEPGASAALAQRCARLPLALRLAAELAVSRPSGTLADLLAELHERQRALDLLSAGSDQRAAVRAVFSWSLQHLEPAAAHAFAMLGLHPAATFDAYALAALVDVALDEVRSLLDALVRAHLVEATGVQRYRMHDLLRAYAASLAGEPAQARAAIGRLLDHYLGVAAAAMDRLYPGEARRRPAVPQRTTAAPDLADPAAARDWLDAELPTLVALAAHGVAHGWQDHAVRLSATLFRYLDGGHGIAGLTIHGHARDAARDIGDRAGEARALNALATLHIQAGRQDLATAQLAEAFRLHAAEDDPVGQAGVLGNLGSIDERASRYAAAAKHYAHALARFRDADDQTGQAHALTRLGTVETRLGRHDAATTHLGRALELHRRAGHEFGVAWALTGLGELTAAAGNPAAAADLCRQAISLFRRLGHRTSEGWAIYGLAGTETQRGRPANATRLHEQALRLFREYGEVDGQVWSLNGLGEASHAAGHEAPARAHHASALAAALRTNVADQQARAHRGIARSHRSDAELARVHYRQAAELYGQLGMPAAQDVRAELAALPDDVTD